MSASHCTKSLAGEKVRPEGIFEPNRRRPPGHDLRGEALRIHRIGGRRPDQIDTDARERGDIGVEGTWIGFQIFGRRELRGVDENRHDHPIGPPLRSLDQGNMPGMQRAHGRY
jgi:hypothetical protein